MIDTYDKIRIFISSASDVPDERRIISDVIRRANNSISNTLNIDLEVLAWEKLPPVTPKDKDIQRVINKEVDRCKIFVLVLYQRYGTPSKGRRTSNLEREVRRALKRLSNGEEITILSYFKQLVDNPDLGPQEKKVIAFRRRLQKQNVFVSKFETARDFEIDFTHDLYRSVLSNKLSNRKIESLKNLWNLGVSDRDHGTPFLLIVYPPVDNKYDNFTSNPMYWKSRLVPNIVFEDYKALQKIEKSLRLIGFEKFKVESTRNYPSSIHERNIFWLCLPRNKLGRKRLEQYKEILRFNLNRRGNKTILQWRNALNNEFFEIASPLGKYLDEQRIESISYNLGMSNIVAKDYAIIARFQRRDSQDSTVYGTLKEYFMAGIRGLGTWGAGWYIDRRFSAFADINKNDDFQMLLEVIYRRGRIAEVRDVSDRPKSYFQNENSLRKIRSIINEYNNTYK